MRKNFLLMMFAILLLGGCKKDKEVRVVRVQAETPDVTTTVNAADISGTYSYASTLKSVVIAYGKDESLSSPQKVTAEHTRDSYSVTINDLEPSTKYYYYCIFDTGYGAAESEQWSFTTQSVSATTVTTSSVSNITPTTATCGGEVTSDGGSTVTARGVCWSTSQNPTVSNSHTADGSGTGTFTSSITGLTENTTYYVRAYATNSAGTSYGEQMSFTTHDAIAGHEYVDLGLPSGLLWATCNVGADSPEDYGDYFAWGETTTKSTYDWSTYKWCNGSVNTLTKYCTKSNYGTVDDKTILDPEDDAAHVNWGGDWHMPTRAELQELYDNTTRKWTTENGVRGYKFTSKTDSDKYIFLPANGYRSGSSLNDAGYSGQYWSGSLYTDNPNYAYYLFFSSTSVTPQYSYFRDRGRSVRPVYGSQSISAPAVTTSSVSNITTTTATCGGNVTSDGGTTVTARGVCWSTSQNPTVSNSHTADGSGTGSFTSSITGLTANRTYYVRAYATNSAETSYGEQMSFTTDHEYVDLGLPSGLLWATCNVGADSPYDDGNYYAWGETEPKSTYNWSTYKWCNGSETTLTKYNTDSNYGTVDNKTVLDPEDDAAHVNWGGAWRIPTLDELQELVDNCTWLPAHPGCRVIGPNGNSIILQMAGYRANGDVYYRGDGFYWSSSLNNTYIGPYNGPYEAYHLDFYFSNVSSFAQTGLGWWDRASGQTVRPVCPSRK